MKKNNGITLIALVITIIVLLILAGVSISMLTGDNGILTKSTQAKENTLAAEEREKVSLAYNEIIANKLDGTSSGNITVEEMENALKNQGVDLTKVTVEEVTGEDKIKVTFTETGREYPVDLKGVSSNSSSSSMQPSDDYLALREGDEVTYTDQNGNTIPCVVLYDSTNENYSTYGVQIISKDTVGTGVELGNGTGSNSTDATHFVTAINSYNDAIEILNRAAEGYKNTNLALDARCVGSVPDNKNYKNTSKKSVEEGYYVQEYNGVYEEGEGDSPNYTSDINKLDSLGKKDIGKKYWLASRIANVYYSYGGYEVCHYGYEYSTNHIGGCFLFGFYASSDSTSNSTTYGLRPVFTLRPDVKVVSGVLTK